MRKLTWLALIAALTLQGAPSSAGQEPPETPPAEDLTALPIDDLIERLPAAGFEWRRDAGRPGGFVDPASVELE